MKINHLDHFLRNVICTSTSLTEAIRMVAVLESIYAFGFMCFGAFLSTSGSSEDRIFGVSFLFSALIYWTLTWYLWMISEKASTIRCKAWIFCSLFNLFLILVLTVTRNSIGSKVYTSSIIWIVAALFLQCYMIMVVWAFMVNLKNSQIKSVVKDSDLAPVPEKENTIPDQHQHANGNGACNSVIVQETNLDDDNSTAV